jgi:hypothetical protein
MSFDPFFVFNTILFDGFEKRINFQILKLK